MLQNGVDGCMEGVWFSGIYVDKDGEHNEWEEEEWEEEDGDEE